MLRELNGHAVRSDEFHLDISSLRHLFGSWVRTVHGASFFNLRPRLCHVLDFHAEVMDATVAQGAFGLGGLVIFELKDREIYMTIA